MSAAPCQNHVWIDNPAKMESFLAEIAGAPRLGIDTEANGFHAYRPRLCLLQLAAQTPRGLRIALVDLLAMADRSDVLAACLEDPERTKILHGADNDVRLLHRDLGVALRGLYDTQVVARLLGEARTGLAALSEKYLEIKLSKSGQRCDWSQRPLPDTARRYAAADAAVLFPLWEILDSLLRKAGRSAWAEEEFLQLESVRYPPWVAPRDEELIARISGNKTLDLRARTVLRELARWREDEARRRDLPPVHILPPKTLPLLARMRHASRQALLDAGLSERVVQRHGSAILAAIRRGLAAAPWHPRPASRGARKPGEASLPAGRMAALKEIRRAQASLLGLDEGTLCPSSVLRRLAQLRQATGEDLLAAGLRRWQRDLIGEAVLALLGGKKS